MYHLPKKIGEYCGAGLGTALPGFAVLPIVPGAPAPIGTTATVFGLCALGDFCVQVPLPFCSFTLLLFKKFKK
jgi:hypothetical protein